MNETPARWIAAHKPLSWVERLRVKLAGGPTPVDHFAVRDEAWEGQASFDKQIEATEDPWLIWRRALNVAQYKYRDKPMTTLQKHLAESEAAREVFGAGFRRGFETEIGADE